MFMSSHCFLSASLLPFSWEWLLISSFQLTLIKVNSIFRGFLNLQLYLQLCLFSGKTGKACAIFVKSITKKYTTLTENIQLKVKSPRYFRGLFNPSIHKSKIYTRICWRLFSYIAITFVWNESFTNSAAIFFKFLFTNSTLEIFKWTFNLIFGPKYLIKWEPFQTVFTLNIWNSLFLRELYVFCWNH